MRPLFTIVKPCSNPFLRKTALCKLLQHKALFYSGSLACDYWRVHPGSLAPNGNAIKVDGLEKKSKTHPFRHSREGWNPVFSSGYEILDTRFRGHDDYFHRYQS